MPLRVILMNLSAVLHAVNQEGQNATGVTAMATGLSDKCSLLYAPSVAKIPKYPSSLAKVDQYIVVIATVKSN